MFRGADDLLDALLYLVALLLSFLIIAKAGDIFVDSACAIARGLNVSRAVIGLTIVSFATTLPEFITSNFASVLGNVEIAYGNAVGTCIFNGAFILGVAALISAILVDRERAHEGLVMLGFGVLVTLLALDGGLSPLEGLLLLLALVIFFGLVLRREVKRRKSVRVTWKGGLRRPAFLFILGAIGVVIGARLLIYSGVGIATLFGVPEATIGFTIVAIGTSLPELATAIISSLKGVAELSLGNIIGANILDLSWVLGTAAVINPLTANLRELLFSNFMMLIVMTTILIFMRTGRRITRREGVVLLALYIAYAAGLFIFWH